VTKDRAATTASAGILYFCRIPRMFRAGGKSARQLVREGHMATNALTINALKSVLNDEPQLIDEWQQWSEDKRTSGWFLTFENGSHVVGHHPKGERLV